MASLAALTACAGRPPAPDWQLNAHDSLERSTQAWLVGDQRIETVEFDRARAALARTGKPELVARAELTRCATRVASLDFGACTGFEPLAQDAGEPERAYARYLAGTATSADVALLPPQHRAMAGAASAAALGAISDPLAALVAAGVAMRRGAADPAIAAIAVDRASAEGWRRPLLAWLTLQLRAAQSAADAAAQARLQRRIDLLGAHRLAR